MKTIATINFKGGVGKTTYTWALGRTATQQPNTTALVFDLDAQMSLTQSIALNEEGNPSKNFTDWYDRSISKRKTIFDALDEFTKTKDTFDFGINHDFIYRIAEKIDQILALLKEEKGCRSAARKQAPRSSKPKAAPLSEVRRSHFNRRLEGE